jgi:hypothetical protein
MATLTLLPGKHCARAHKVAHPQHVEGTGANEQAYDAPAAVKEPVPR